jgi:hypothetical protein
VCNFPFLPYVRPPLGVDGVFFWSLTSVILVVAEEAGGREGGTGHYAFYRHYAHYTTSRKQETTGRSKRRFCTTYRLPRTSVRCT